jgi:thioredoxin-related protein
MKKIINFIFLISLTFQLFGQIPNLQIKDTIGNFFNLPDYLENDKNYALIIWSAQIPPSISALEDYHNYYNDWVSNYNIEFLIVSIDEENIHDAVIDYVNQQGWQYTLFFSSSEDVMQAFGINAIPYIFLINMSHEIVYEVAGYLQGNLLDQEISQLFPNGLNELNTLKNLNVFSIDKNIIIETEIVMQFLKMSVFTIDGKKILHNTYDNEMLNRIQLETSSLSIGTIVIVKIENSYGDFITRKIIIK